MRQMRAWYLRCLGMVTSLALAAVVVLPVSLLGDPAIRGTFATQARQHRLVESYGKLPLSFELNQGQTDRRVKFLSRGSGYALFLTANEAVLTLHQGSPMSKPGAAWADRRSALTNGQLQPVVFKPAHAGQQSPQTTATAVVRMRLVDANPRARISGLEQLPGRRNYFIGNDPTNWRTNVPTYAKVKYANVYPGVDLIYYGNQRQLEYDFVVQPGADPAQIKLVVESSDTTSNHHHELRINPNGDLVVSTSSGNVKFHKPVVYQPEVGADRLAKNDEQSTRYGRPVEGRYRLKGNNVSFAIASYDNRRPLVIDPTLAYSTYLGGSGRDGGSAIAVDGSGNAYITGFTESADFPITRGAFQTSLGSTLGNAFVSKLNAAGSALLYSTYLGGSGDVKDGFGDNGSGIAVDSSGNAYITGTTTSTDFPTTPGAFQTTKRGFLALNAFVSKLNPTGSALVYSTYLGGNVAFEFDRAYGIAVDRSGNAFVTGLTNSMDFPTTPGAFQTTYGGSYDVFVSKLKSDGSALVYSTYLGGTNLDSAFGIALDSSGNVYVTGETISADFPTTPGTFQTSLGSTVGNAFVSKLNAAGSKLLYSTYLGGSGDVKDGFGDNGSGIAVDGSGNAYITGTTTSTDFPTTPGAFQSILRGVGDAFVSRLNASGSALIYSTYLGGNGSAGSDGIALDGSDNAYVTGITGLNFPTTPDAFQTSLGGPGAENAFVSKLKADGSTLLYSTYLGGSGGDAGVGIALDASGSAYVTGQAGSTDFPTTPGAFQTTYGGGNADTFVSKFSFGIAFSQFGGHLRIDADAGVFSLNGTFTLGSGGSINPLTQQVSFSVNNYAVIVPAGSFFKVSNGYVYQKKVNNIFLCLYIIKNKNTPGRYSLLANSGHDALTGTTTSPLPVMLTIGDNSGSTDMNAKFE